MQPRLFVPDEPNAEHRDAVAAPLLQFNADHGYPADSRPVAVLLKDGDDRTVGGVWGRTS